MKTSTYAVVAAVALGLASAGFWLWRYRPLSPQVATPHPVPAAARAPVAQAPAASEPTIKHPIDAPVTAEPPAPAMDVQAALAELFGRKAVLSLFQLEDFPRRFAATVDNLGRAHAPASLWPVNPTAGRFLVDRQAGSEIIGADNGLRYTPYVLLLLATPELNGPLKLRLPAIGGPVQPERPWLLYEFEDPALQALTSGQRTLLRMGPVNQRRVKLKLAEIRRLVTARSAPR